MKQTFLVDTAETFQTYVWEDNQIIVPSSATVVIYKPNGDTVLQASASMSVAGDGLLSYSLTVTHNDIADENYKAVISYVVSGTTYVATLFYDVVNSKLHKVITDEDIVNELPQLKENGWRVHGTASSGSTTTIIDNDLKRYDNDYFTGGLAYSITQDETRKITDFVSSTGTVTVADFPSTAASDKYILTRAYTKEIQRAFEKIEQLLVNQGRRPQLILDPYDLREVHIQYAVAEICKGLVTEEAGMWFEFMERYEKRAYAMFKSLNLKYDTSDDGYIAGSEESRRFNLRAGRN